ncbi:MAG: helix-turn-helix domain-containing protein, partial [Synergistetes bacterium]|nr:helix-turn-helix domain-containing protein [Synergistota bacterium]
EDIASYIGLLGYDLFLPRFAIAIGIPEYGVVVRNALKMMEESLSTRPLRYDVKERVINICSSFVTPEKGDIVAHVGGGLFMILKVENKCRLASYVDRDDVGWLDNLLFRLEKEMKVSAYAGIGSCTNSIGGLKVSFREALNALEMGIILSRFGFQERKFFNGEPLVMLGSILRSADSELRSNFVTNILKGVLKDKELLSTLRIYLFSDMNARIAAQKLFIHKNTLFYRLKKVKKLTGLDPQKPVDAFYLWLALCIEPLVGSCLP